VPFLKALAFEKLMALKDSVDASKPINGSKFASLQLESGVSVGTIQVFT